MFNFLRRKAQSQKPFVYAGKCTPDLRGFSNTAILMRFNSAEEC